ncbi:MAG: hypothetical protein BIFFINMI_00162 [Phycisphaerae bacterium]|nr:hypothetical protein [Phycisphaerae bacterium]
MRPLRLALILALATLSGGCREQQQRKPAGPPSAAPASRRYAPRQVDKVILFTPRPLDEMSIGPAVREGLDRLADTAGVSTSMREVAVGALQPAIADAIGDGHDLIVLLTPDYLPELQVGDVARFAARIACIGPNYTGVPVDSVHIRLDEPSYLCGLIAAHLSETRRVVPLAMNTPDDMQAVTAFANGARSAGLAVQVLDSPRLPALPNVVRRIADEQIRAGADVLFNLTPWPQSAIDAAAERPGILVLNGWQASADSTGRLVASARVDMGRIFQQLLARARAGDPPDKLRFSLREGGVAFDLTPSGRSRLKPDAVERLDKAVADIRSGVLDVQRVATTQPATNE